MNKSYCLVGLPYSGKSFLGYKISYLKKKTFYDTDIILKQKYNRNLSSIIKNHGINNFILKETDTIKTIKGKNIVLSPGGSVIYSNNSIDYIKNTLNCEIINLHMSYEEFCNRIHNYDERGIINKENLSLNELYLERVSLCRYHSDITFNANNKSRILKELLHYIK